jgi:hypothetical protein
VEKYRKKGGVKTGQGRKKTGRECKKHRKGAVKRQAPRGYKETGKEVPKHRKGMHNIQKRGYKKKDKRGIQKDKQSRVQRETMTPVAN